jgi:hypothetical protein
VAGEQPQACGKDVTEGYQIERPTGLSTRSPVPAVLASAGTVGSNPNWIAESAVGKFVLVVIKDYHATRPPAPPTCCQYAFPTTGPVLFSSVSGLSDCGPSGNLACDDIPMVQAILDAIECKGAPPCENINRREVFAEGGSRGGGFSLDMLCDRRISRRIAGIQDVSGKLDSPGSAPDSPPNCPALLGSSPNRKWSAQFIWGTADPNISCGSPPSTANNCLGTGYTSEEGRWEALGPLATTELGTPVLGCPTIPARTVVYGNSGKITKKLYAPCSAGARPATTATETIKVQDGGHMPDTWPAGTDRNGSDGLKTPAEAWAFWTAYFS